MSDSSIPLGDGKFAVALDQPRTIDELRETVRTRVGQGHAIYPQGGCTSLDYGDPPSREGVAISTRHLSRVIDYPHEDMTITIEAGMTLAAIDAILDTQQQRLCIDAPQRDRATIGGMLATNWTGPKRYGLGRPRDQIIGISFVNAAAELIHGGGRVVKNVAGYDFPKLLTGSMGTLGIIAEVTLKVRPKPEVSAIVLVEVAPAKLALALDRLNTSQARPIAIEVLVGLKGLPQRGAEGSKGIVAVGLEGTQATVGWEQERVLHELSQYGGEPPRDRTWVGNNAQETWDAMAWSDRTDQRVSIQANIRPSMVAHFLGEFDPLQVVIQAHAGNGIVRVHLEASRGLEDTHAAIVRLRQLARSYGGSLTVLKCPTAWKPALKVWGDPRPDWLIAERIKKALDPTCAMNPGRFVGNI